MKKLLMVFAILLMFTTGLFASRNSDDIVTATNSAFNNYIQDVIGNKSDTSNGDSLMGFAEKINAKASVGAASLAALNVLATINTNLNALIIIDVAALNALGTINTNLNALIQALATVGNAQSLSNRGMNSRIEFYSVSNQNMNVRLEAATAAINALGTVNTNLNALQIIDLAAINTLGTVNTNLNALLIVDVAALNALGTVNTNLNNLIQDLGTINTNLNALLIVDAAALNALGTINTNLNALQIVDLAAINVLGTINTNLNALIRLNTETNLSQQNVPAGNSAANTHMRDVIGNKTDTHDGNSIYAYIETILDHAHNQSRVFPTMSVGSNVETKAAVTWSVSNNYTNIIVPASGITSDFDIHYLSIENISANSVCEIILINMTDKTEIGRVRVTKNAAQDGTMNVPIQTPIQDANDKIGAQMGSSVAGTTVTFSIFYHTY